jgi:hypothetical protein
LAITGEVFEMLRTRATWSEVSEAALAWLGAMTETKTIAKDAIGIEIFMGSLRIGNM